MKDNAHVVVLGAGALGSLLGARLAQTEARVSLITIDGRHAAAIRKDGLVVEELDGSESRHRLVCCGHPHDLHGKADLVLVLVKSYSSARAVAGVLDACHASTLFLTLQNGLGNWETIAGVAGEQAVLLGTTTQGATLVAPGRVRHGGNGPTVLGERTGAPSERVDGVVTLFRRGGFECRADSHMERLVWHKLIANVGINAITALTLVPNGWIAQQDAARRLAQAAVDEALRVAAAHGLEFPGDPWQDVLAIARATARNVSSMRQDVEARRRTEIDAINGAVVRLGVKLGVPTPVNWTLTQLIDIRQNAYR